MSMLSKFLWGSKKKNPADAAMPYYDKAAAAQQPYATQGQQAGGVINPIYQRQAQDPTGAFEDIASKYQASDAYKLKRDEALRGAGAAAAAGGFRGGQQDLVNSTNITNRLLGDDFQKWYNNVIGQQNTGLEGSQHTADQGFNAATNQANIYGNQGQAAATGQAWQNQQQQDRVNQLLKLIGAGGGAAAGFMMPGGNSLTALQGAQSGSRFF